MSGEVYIRFGDVPPGERSSTGAQEALAAGFSPLMWLHLPTHEVGVSVFSARRTGRTTYVADVSASLELAVCFAECLLNERPAYLAAGRHVGTGVAGEPLLRDVKLEPLPPGSRVISSGHYLLEAAKRLDALRRHESAAGRGVA